jgi:hypothetical protein
MVRITDRHLAAAGSIIAIVIAVGTLILTYGRAEGASGATQTILVKEVAEIKADNKAKMQLETTLQVELGKTIVAISEFNKRLDRLEGKLDASRPVIEPRLASTAIR